MAGKSEKLQQTYRDTLDITSKQRYDDKIGLIEKQDPYTLEKHRWTQDVDKWASVTYPDIVNYLLFSTSAYTMDELKSYKGLEAYNQFVSDWVRDVKVCEISGLCVHTAKVMHSQRLSETPLTPWAIIQKDGKILACHCNCMAGLGEACTHLAAMLFSIEATVKVREARTVTDSKAYWLPASVKGVVYAKIEDIDFTSAKSQKRKLDQNFLDTPLPKKGLSQLKPVNKPTDNELSAFLHQLSLTGAQSAVLSIKETFQQPFIPKVLNNKFPKLLSELFNDELIDASFSEILAYCKNVNVSVSKEESKSVELATRSQSETKLWNQFRSGRITASRMYAACHSSPAQPSESLIKSICNPESMKFVSAATNWGCSHEKDARESYCEALRTMHENFAVEDAGFTIHPEYPLFGASPDAFVSCDCCGQGVLEIKCPYCIRSSTLDNYTGPKSCLEDTDHGKRLKRVHPYFYQVQTQIKLCEREFADFVVWTSEEVHIERIELDRDFWEDIISRAANFHNMAIMPEIVSRFYSRLNKPVLTPSLPSENNQSNGSSDVFCYCQQGETDTMVACDNQNCKYQWFHLQCLGLRKNELPKGKWYCQDCSRLDEFKPKRRCIRKKTV
ncbi:hypothetical protein ACJMK2_013340 [Sinanodonta woodiana]|uniref:PHD-type domain-containing protein n=1 Tax=Sinanodonta woodiana TaxID=1069815 RepID=A0ABD3UX93_SINWO